MQLKYHFYLLEHQFDEQKYFQNQYHLLNKLKAGFAVNAVTLKPGNFGPLPQAPVP